MGVNWRGAFKREWAFNRENTVTYFVLIESSTDKCTTVMGLFWRRNEKRAVRIRIVRNSAWRRLVTFFDRYKKLKFRPRFWKNLSKVLCWKIISNVTIKWETRIMTTNNCSLWSTIVFLGKLIDFFVFILFRWMVYGKYRGKQYLFVS